MATRKSDALLGLCGIVAPIFFVLTVVVASAFYPGYSHLTQAISELGGVDSPNPMIQNANFFLVGLLIVAFAFGLHRSIGSGKGSALGPTLLGIFGAVTVAQGFLPCDSGCEWVSTVGSLHNSTGLGSFLAVVAGIFVLSRRLLTDPDWEPYSAYSVITAVAGIVALISWIGIAKAARVESLNGVLQRVFVAIILLWIEIMAIRMFSLLRRSSA